MKDLQFYTVSLYCILMQYICHQNCHVFIKTFCCEKYLILLLLPRSCEEYYDRTWQLFYPYFESESIILFSFERERERERELCGKVHRYIWPITCIQYYISYCNMHSQRYREKHVALQTLILVLDSWDSLTHKSWKCCFVRWGVMQRHCTECVWGSFLRQSRLHLWLWVCDMCLQLLSTTSKCLEQDKRIHVGYKRLIVKDETCTVPCSSYCCFRHYWIIHFVPVEATCVIIHPITLCHCALFFPASFFQTQFCGACQTNKWASMGLWMKWWTQFILLVHVLFVVFLFMVVWVCRFSFA